MTEQEDSDKLDKMVEDVLVVLSKEKTYIGPSAISMILAMHGIQGKNSKEDFLDKLGKTWDVMLEVEKMHEQHNKVV